MKIWISRKVNYNATDYSLYYIPSSHSTGDCIRGMVYIYGYVTSHGGHSPL